MPLPDPYKASAARARVVLDFHPLDRGLRQIQTGQEIQSVANFCSLLRTSKLIYFQNDRQEPGAYDEVADELARLGDEAMEKVPRKQAALELKLALETIRSHVTEIRERITTPVRERPALDRKRLGDKFRTVAPMDWTFTSQHRSKVAN